MISGVDVLNDGIARCRAVWWEKLSVLEMYQYVVTVLASISELVQSGESVVEIPTGWSLLFQQSGHLYRRLIIGLEITLGKTGAFSCF